MDQPLASPPHLEVTMHHLLGVEVVQSLQGERGRGLGVGGRGPGVGGRGPGPAARVTATQRVHHLSPTTPFTHNTTTYPEQPSSRPPFTQSTCHRPPGH